MAQVDRPGHNFSFSGLKTAVLQHWQGLDDEEREAQQGKVAAAFRKAVIDALLAGLEAALDETGAPRVAVAGGVANNRLLRREIAALAERRGVEVAFPSPRLCTDNAAMIAAVGAYHLVRGQRDDLTMDAEPSLRLASREAPPADQETPGGRA